MFISEFRLVAVFIGSLLGVSGPNFLQPLRESPLPHATTAPETTARMAAVCPQWRAPAERAEEKVWHGFLQRYLSPEYIAKHFQILGSYGSPHLVTLNYLIKYGNEIAHTRTTNVSHGELSSGIARVSGGAVVSYFGPLKEYEPKISMQRAVSVMLKQGCSFASQAPAKSQATRPRSGRAQPPSHIILFVGDYWEKQGKYSRDFIPEGFYWLGGKPPKSQSGTQCMVDAETGAFKVKPVGIH